MHACFWLLCIINDSKFLNLGAYYGKNVAWIKKGNAGAVQFMKPHTFYLKIITNICVKHYFYVIIMTHKMWETKKGGVVTVTEPNINKACNLQIM